MRYGARLSAKKIILIVVSCLVAVALVVTGILFAINSRTANATIDVEQVSMVSTMYWGDQSSTYGTATSDFVQELYPDTTKSISEIFVQEGQSVKIGDTLLQYDTTRLELTVEGKELEVEKQKYELEQANKELTQLQNTTPYVEPTPPPYVPEPTPTPVPESKAKLYAEITVHSKPFKGTGTTEDPYVFLCTEDCVLTKDFLMRLLGLDGLKPTPTPEPSAEPTPDVTPTPEPSAEPTAVPTEEPTPEPTKTPESSPEVSGMAWLRNLTTSEADDPDFELPNGPFAARFEVHEEDNENLPFLKGWVMDGSRISAGFLTEISESPEDNIDMLDLDTDVPGIMPMSYADSMYTAEQLKEMIAQKKQEIKDLELSVKQAKIDLSKAELELENATVISTVNGTVKTLTDLDSALFSGTPFLVVSGGDGFYVTGTLNESLLGRIHVGDFITASSWETGMSYSAEIVKISDFPLDSNNYYYDGSSNPNTSNYTFTAFIQDAEGLQNGMWLDIILQAGAEEDVPSDTFYLSKAYIRSDDVGRYVLKVGSDKRVHKEYVQTGKTVYNEYLEIKSDNLTQDDYVAFPYGTAAIEGAKANLPEDVEIDGEEDIEQ